MDLGLRDRVVAVTGASKGIGRACAAAFAAEGARVALVSRSRANLDAALAAMPAGARVQAFAADLVDAVQARATVDAIERALGPIDVLVNCAGAAKRYPPDELDAAAWRAAMDAKFFSYIHPTDVVVKRMAARGRGAIVNVVGSGGRVANPVHLPGGAANAALMLATAGLAAAYAAQGVRVNAINPGLTLTGRVQEGLEAESRMTGLGIDELQRRAEARIPIGRLGTPEEIAQVALFLASDRASYVTGAIVPMDGAANPVL
ncbi:MAG: SDR family oxidoreductase [Betaproteobacteria bacterium]|jgi:NAD(P)-dependent dehydrogenase (short-subunit alcohol dehydrogenase family)|nr:SDR family oxidoreductase [Betaproteobacteria bacterium]MDH5286283.1 SDR family oxidoreductase [Betaproteobacteria bacterium]